MKNKLLLILTLFCLMLVLSLPVMVYAQGEAEGEAEIGDPDAGVPSGAGSGGLTNPLGSVVNPQEIMGNIIRAILGVTGSLALGVFMLGGLTWVMSAGNEEKITKGKNMVIWAAFGLAVIFASYALVTLVLNAITGGG